MGRLGLFIFDADNNVRRDLDCDGDVLTESCWVVIDDYFGPAKAAPFRAQVDALVSEGRLVPWILRVGHVGRPVVTDITSVTVATGPG